ncbi:MAG: hypothetical protein QNJ78_15275 [Gammaproteobacteria bacterium]|nr:hypothetical protein [Gammaproteobacteria bacterium]
MSRPTLYSIIESPSHPDFSALYQRLKINEVQFKSMRKAMLALKRQSPDFVVAEFFYGYANNYAGVNISNLDVFLFSLQKYAPNARVLVLVEKQERQYVDALNKILPLHAVLQQPVSLEAIKNILTDGKGQL